MNYQEIENRIKSLKPDLESQFFVKKIGYFGSYARNEQTSESDLDLLVEVDNRVGWKFFDIAPFIEEKLGLEVDLITPGSIKEQLRSQILSEVKYL